MYVIATDFDLTLSCDHCGGNPLLNPPSNGEQIRSIVSEWQSQGHTVILVTRAINECIMPYMTKLGITMPIYAPSYELFTKNCEIKFWAQYKCSCIKVIQTTYPNHHIIFIDDMVENVKYVKKHLKDVITLHANAGNVLKNVSMVNKVISSLR